MKKRIFSLILALATLLSPLASCGGNVPAEQSTEATSKERGPEYSISYDLDGGTWKNVYYTLDELFENFKSDYNASGGSISKASDLDTAYLDSADFANVYTSTKMQVKWFWLLRALWEQSDKASALNPRDCNFKTDEAKAFYLAQLCGFFTQTKHTDTYLLTVSADYSDPETVKTVLESGPAKDETPGEEKYYSGEVTKLRSLTKYGFVFLGWQCGDRVITEIDEETEGNLELKAVWKEGQKPLDVIISGIPDDGIGVYSKLQLGVKVTPADAFNKGVKIKSLNTDILTVTDSGVVTAKAAGVAKIKITLSANPDFEKTVEIKVYKGNYFEAQYMDESYTFVGKDISLKSVYHDPYGGTHDVTWSSLTPEIASVDAKGKVHPLKTGLAKIRSSYDNVHYIDFVVTVLDNDISDEMRLVLDSHNSNALTVYNLGIGGSYYYDVVGGVSDLLFDDLKVDRTYYDKFPSGTNNFGTMSSIDFVTVHYTGNMNKGADADNNAAYFSNAANDVSIHYVTGRTNLYGDWTEDSYAAFACLREEYGAWHASTSSNQCVWDKTGVKVKASDPETPVISISDDLYYTINGQKTTIKIPTPPEGHTVKGNTVTYNGKTATAINSLGLRTKIVDGEYRLCRTWWGHQRTPKALCSYGGNTNSIGIESCVDMGSDLMHTWHVTAQLVADILVRNNLGLDRVVGHHFFSGKNCPQPLLENDQQLWYEFMDMVKAEYEKLTKFKDVQISAKAVDGCGILRDNGLLEQNGQTNIVTYEVTIKKNGKTEKVTLATAVESTYSYTGTRTQDSLQQQGYDIR